MNPFAPWTHSVYLTWRPSLEFFDRKIDLLRFARDAQVLHSFRVDGDGVSAQLTQRRRLAVGVTYLTLHSYDGLLEDAFVLDLLEGAFVTLEPEDVEVSVSFQHLAPIGGASSFEDVCRVMATSSQGDLAAAIGMSDVAVLMDGSMDGGVTSYNVEYGVIRDADAPLRLARLMGRMTSPGAADGLEDLQGQKYPRVSLFVDSSWQSKIQVKTLEELPEWVVSFSSQVSRNSETLSKAVYSPLLTALRSRSKGANRS